jgi:hypothetical protein
METQAFVFRLKGAHEMSLTEKELSSKNAVFDEWTTKYTQLKTYTQHGIAPARTISADDLVNFKAPDETWLKQTRQQRGRSGPAGKPKESQTESSYTVQFSKTSDLTDVVQALRAGTKATGTSRIISLFIAWEQAGASAPSPWKCASITIKLP